MLLKLRLFIILPTLSGLALLAVTGCQIKGSITHVASLTDGTLVETPSSLTLVTPASSPGTVDQPLIRVRGVVNGATVGLFSDSACTVQVGTALVTAAPTVDITITPALTIGSYTFYANSANTGGHASTCSTSSLSYTLTSISPTVTSITSTLANGSYKSGQVVPITVTFSSIVNVTGTPQLTIGLTPANKAIDYASGSGTNTLTFNYTVAGTDTTAALDYINTTALALNGGTIQDASAHAATLTLPTPGAANSLSANKSIVIDTTAPTVTNLTSSTANGYYRATQSISIQVVFSSAVTVTGTPQLTLATAPNEVVNYVSGSGTSTLNFTYTVQPGDSAADLDYTATTSLALNGGTIQDAAGNSAVLTLPAPAAAGSLGANKNIIIQTAQPSAPSALSLVTPASSPGNVNTPTIQVSGVTSAYVVQLYSDFTCTALVGNVTSAGVTTNITTGALADGSYTFYANQTDQAGNVSNCSVANVAYVLNTATPTVTNVTSTLASGSYKLGQVVPITVTFSSVVNVTGTPQLTVGLTPANKAINYASGTGTNTLTFNYTVAGTDTTSALDYVSTASLALNGGTIKNAATTNATLTLPALAGAGDLAFNKTIIIDTTAPATPSGLSLVTPASSPGNNQTPVIQVSGVANTDIVTLYSDSGCTAAISSATTSSGATVNITTNSLAVGAYTIYAKSADLATNASACSAANVAYTVDLTAPTVTNVTSSTANGAYKAAQAISIQVVFSKSVVVTGTPQLTLATAPNEVVNYASGSGTGTLTFTYTVQPADTAADLEYTATSSLALNGGTIKDAAGNSATLTLPAPAGAGSLGANKNIVIDTTAPTTPTSLVLTTPASSPGTSSTPTITVSGGVVSSDIVTLYSDSGCTAAISSGTTSAGASVAVTTSALALGSYTIYAQSTDLAGNASSCSTANVAYNYIVNPLGAFTISGVTGPGDAVLDTNLNAGVLATINWNASTAATSYDVTIYDAAGSVVICALQNTASTSYAFSACTLTAGTTYNAKVTAKVGGLTLDASNSMYAFFVNQNPVAATLGPLYLMTNGSIAVNVVASATDADAGETLTVGTVGAPSHGSTTNTATTITYTPTASYAGADSFTYTITDSHGGTSTGTVNVSMMSAFTWTGASGSDNHWSTSGNWCGSTKVDHSGCNGGGAPGNGDTAIFDNTCTSNCTASMTGDVSITTLKISAGTVQQNAFNLSLSGDFNQSGGTFTGSSNAAKNISISGNLILSGGSFTATAGTTNLNGNITVSGAPTFNANSGLLNYAGIGTLTPGSINLNNLYLYTSAWGNITIVGSLNVNGALTIDQDVGHCGGGGIAGGAINSKGDITLTAACNAGSTALNIIGTGAQTITGVSGGVAPATTITSTGTINLAGTINFGSSFTYTSGTVNAGASTVNFQGASISAGTIAFNNVGLFTSQWLNPNIASTMTVNGDLTISQDSNHCGSGLSGGPINLAGNLTISHGCSGATLVVNINGSGTQTVTGTAFEFAPPLTIASSGTVNLAGSIAAYTPFTYTSGTVSSGASTVTFFGNSTITPGAINFNNVGLSSFAYNHLNLSGTLNVGGNLDFSMTGACGSGILGGTINVGGNLSATQSCGGTTQLVLNGTGAQSISQASGTFPGSLFTISNTAATVSLTSNLILDSAVSMTLANNATVTMAGHALTVPGTLTIGSGATLTRAGGTLTDGSLSNSGTLNP
jgi:hypothetical protein